MVMEVIMMLMMTKVAGKTASVTPVKVMLTLPRQLLTLATKPVFCLESC